MVGSFGGVKKIDAANGAGRLFLGNLVNEVDRGIVDEGAVYVFGHTAAFARLEGYVTDRNLLQDAVPTTATADSTCLYDAIIRVSAELGTRNIPGRRMMVVLTDGRNDCSSSTVTLQDAITAAQNAGIRVYTIGIGVFNPSDLTQIANQTGGFYSEALTPGGLLASYQRIISALSKNQPASFTLKGRSVAPELEVSHSSLSFDSVRIGRQRCAVISLQNTGDAPLNLDSVIPPNAHFSITPATIPEIPPGESLSLQICFEPKKLRAIDSEIIFNYRRCVPKNKSVVMDGIGYDSVVISIGGLYYARPGDVVTIPIHLQGQVPASYDMDSLELTFQYNKTLLHPEPFDAPLSNQVGSAQVFLSQIVEPTYDEQNAHLRIALSNGTLNSTQSDTVVLTELRLLALHGNALETPVTLTSARFADGNPKVGIVGEVRYTSDSLCFLDELLIDASARFGPTMKLVSVGGGQAHVNISLENQAQLRIQGELFDPLGNRIARIFDRVHGEGELQVLFDTSPLPQGIYWLRLVVEGTPHEVLKIPVQN